MTETTARALYENFFEAATITAPGFSTALPATLLQNRDQTVLAETLDLDPDNTQFDCDFGTSQPVDGVIVTNGNWSLDATRRIILSDHADMSSPLYDSGWGTFPGFVVADTSLLPADCPDAVDGVLRETLLAEFPLCMIEWLPSRVRPRYQRVMFNDPDNPDGVLRMAYCLSGRAIRPSVNYTENNRFPTVAGSSMTEALGMNRYWQEFGLRRTWQGEFLGLTQEEINREWQRMAVKARDSRPVFFSMDPSDPVYLQQRSFLATLREPSAIQQLLGQTSSGKARGAVSLALDEFK